MEKYRSRRHCLLLYAEDSTHAKAIEHITMNYDYALILHDKDCDENGELKKEHYHLIVEFKSAKWRSALAKELGIAENYIEQVNNYEKALEYLIHYNDDDKFHYEIDDVKGTLKRKLEKLLANDGKDENEKALELLEFINNHNCFLSASDFSSWCASVGKWDIFRRGAIIYLRILDEHNDKFKIKEYDGAQT